MPELHWLTPIFHPNISANGLVCLGGYSTNWVPSLRLDDLCLMLWDMIRYRNFDIGSPYNRVAAEWARTQRHYILPLDPRPLRDQGIAQGLAAGGAPAAGSISAGGEMSSRGSSRVSPTGSLQDTRVGWKQEETGYPAAASAPAAEITFL
jgi:hypothetical protein